MGNEYNEATDGLVKLFRKANHDLDIVHHRLQTEFQQQYPENANPMKLVSRIKKIQEEISILKGQCHELLAAKQDLIDKAQTVLVENRNLVQRMQSSVGIPFTSEDDDAFTNFKQVIDEWTDQIRSKTGNEPQDSDSGDLNKLLFSAIVQSN
ncbi:putative spindle and kinetochore-associated protein [Medicago truncatula]|uniref:Protein FAM33A n=1 Tax=Medicago truncatula TaxID=3880 RepID=G7I7L6_MEDTR|nr:uncharacterized protein LOC11432389 [Medicago truncatula]AES59068.1 hypothetical protein MTR_1g013640 [Medicago truncatula]RHN77034.1 putative spindle and kinetochore-associated protein [Medicago truncatula]